MNSLNSILESLETLPFPDSGKRNVWERLAGFIHGANEQEHFLYYKEYADFLNRDTGKLNLGLLKQAESKSKIDFQEVLAESTRIFGTPHYTNFDLVELGQKIGFRYTDEPPRFEHEIASRGGLALAYWCREDRIIFVKVEHQDQDTPIQLVLGSRVNSSTVTTCQDTAV